MKRQALLIFSHQLTGEQEKDLLENWGVTRIVPMPKEVSSLWRNIPPDIHSLKVFLRPVLEWLIETAYPGDLVLVQGDFGATYIVANFSIRVGYVPIYSTTKREVEEKTLPGGIVEQSRVFSHCIFRKYEA